MILLRSTFPRYRYDQLMLLCWISIFPTEWLYFYVCFILGWLNLTEWIYCGICLLGMMKR